jgi:hypothetical protein
VLGRRAVEAGGAGATLLAEEDDADLRVVHVSLTDGLVRRRGPRCWIDIGT